MCSTTQFMVHHIPAILYGDSSDNLFLYIHGKMGRKEEKLTQALRSRAEDVVKCIHEATGEVEETIANS